MKTAAYWMSSPGSPWAPRTLPQGQPVLIWTISAVNGGESTNSLIVYRILTHYQYPTALGTLLQSQSPGATVTLALALYKSGEVFAVKSWTISNNAILASFEYGLPEFRPHCGPWAEAVAHTEDQLKAYA